MTPKTRDGDNPDHSFLTSERGVSVPIDYALGLLILLVLSGLFVAGIQSIADEREEAVTEQELDRIGSEVTNALVEADTLATEAETRENRATGNNDVSNVELRVDLPPRVNDDSFTVSVTQDSDNLVNVSVQSQGEMVVTPVQVDRDVEDSSSGSGDLRIIYTDEGNLELEDTES